MPLAELELRRPTLLNGTSTTGMPQTRMDARTEMLLRQRDCIISTNLLRGEDVNAELVPCHAESTMGHTPKRLARFKVGIGRGCNFTSSLCAVSQLLNMMRGATYTGRW